jgi:hypothetical protein
MQVDLAMPANFTDPSSKTTYFQSATMLSKASGNLAHGRQLDPAHTVLREYLSGLGWRDDPEPTSQPGSELCDRQPSRQSVSHTKHLRTLDLLPPQRNLLSVRNGSAQLHYRGELSPTARTARTASSTTSSRRSTRGATSALPTITRCRSPTTSAGEQTCKASLTTRFRSRSTKPRPLSASALMKERREPATT